MKTEVEALFEEENPKLAAHVLENLLSDWIEVLDRVVEPAVHGRISAVRSYVRAWRGLQDQVLRFARDAEPDLVAFSGDRIVVFDVRGHASQLRTEIVEQGALHAPFSPWVLEFGAGRGVALFLLADVRRALRDVAPLLPSVPVGDPFPDVGVTEFGRFARLVWHELTAVDPLAGIASTLTLSKTELGRLFGVERQAISQWETDGVPTVRLPRVHTVQRIADVLARNLKPDRIASVVRKPSDAYGGRSILEAIADGDEGQVLEAVERAFDWAATA